MPGEVVGASVAGATQLDVQVVGHLRVAGMDVALPLSALREALPCPAELDGMPADAPGLLGAINHRSSVLPVLHLGAVTGRPIARTAGDVVVVVAWGDRTVGLLTEVVEGIVRVDGPSLVPTAARGGDLLFATTFTHPSTGKVISVLDPAVLTALPGIPMVDRSGAGTHDSGTHASGSGDTTVAGVVAGLVDTQHAAPPVMAADGESRQLMLVRSGGQALAIDVAHVHTTTPRSVPRASVLTSDLCRGVVDFRDVEVPVVDPLVLFGLGRMPEGPIDAGLVLSSSHGFVILAVNALLDLTVVPASDVFGMPAFSLQRPELVAGIYEGDGTGPCIVIDGAALLQAPEVLALGSVNTSLAGQVEDARGSARGRGPGGRSGGGSAGGHSGGPDRPAGAGADKGAAAGAHLVFTAGVELTTALDQVVEILPHPPALTDTSVGGPVLGVHVHRGRAIPLLGLTALLGKPVGGITASSCVLVVDVDGEYVGFTVDSLSQVNRLSWSDPDGPDGSRGVDLSRLLPGAPLVQVEGDDKLLPALDLRAIARAVRDPASATRALTPA